MSRPQLLQAFLDGIRSIGGKTGCKNGPGFSDVHAHKTAFADAAPGHNHFFMQSLIVAAKHHQAGVSDDCRAVQRGIGRQSGSYTIEPFAGAARPDFRAQQAQAHLHQAVIEMRQDHVVPAACQRVIEQNGTNFLCVRMGETSMAFCPAAGERRNFKYRAGLDGATRIGPKPGHGSFLQWGMPRQLQSYLDHRLDVFR